jgi:hypothetical protein
MIFLLMLVMAGVTLTFGLYWLCFVFWAAVILCSFPLHDPPIRDPLRGMTEITSQVQPQSPALPSDQR